MYLMDLVCGSLLDPGKLDSGYFFQDSRMARRDSSTSKLDMAASSTDHSTPPFHERAAASSSAHAQPSSLCQ